ncbi:MAG: YciI family protein [Planctomycetota bacterium]
MKYLLLVYCDEAGWTDEEHTACREESVILCQELKRLGQFIDAAPLHPVATATSVRIRQGKRLITDGPFAETTEQLGGFYLVDLANLDEAIALASRIPPARKGTIEIRPIHDLSSSEN